MVVGAFATQRIATPQALNAEFAELHQRQLANLSPDFIYNHAQDYRAAVTEVENFLDAQKAGDYRLANQLGYASFTGKNRLTLFLDYFSHARQYDDFKPLYHALIKANIPTTPLIAQKTLALNILVSYIQESANVVLYRHNPLSGPFYLFLTALILSLFILADYRNQAENFSALLPQNRFKTLLTRQFSGIIFALAFTLVTLGLFLVLVALLPGHSFGFFNYPLPISLPGQTEKSTLTFAAYLGLYFIFYALWTIFLAAVLNVVALIDKNFIVLAAVAGVLIFSEQLGLLSSKLYVLYGQFTPFYYQPFSDIILGERLGQTGQVGLGIVVLLVWSALFTGLALIIPNQRKK